MKQPMPLYTGGGVSLSPINAEGRKLSAYVRLVAEDGMAITDGAVITTCIDVLSVDTHKWSDCDLPEEEAEATEADYQNALREMGVEA